MDNGSHNGVRWEYLAFDSLSPAALYALLKLRSEIFVVEQECVFLDPDGLDQDAFHCLGWEGSALVAYQRCLPPGIPYAESSIGRIVIDPRQRGRDLGRELVVRGIEFNARRWPGHPIRIGAQARLTRFYESLGFVVDGEMYMEDGIEHVNMLRETTPSETTPSDTTPSEN